ncbi:MAG: hypothetical protein OEX04_14085 [Acidimicrobiia bacterium]|nr:hypothetical protein [Acidimicrobiia bacterium]MDH4308595.1 hypothetical protein [Acidimicrobiia bacterium]
MRQMALASVGAAAVFLSIAQPAWAEPLEPFIQRSTEAEFSGQQVISCDTPDGTRSVAIEVTQSDGVTTARSPVGGRTEVHIAGGSFAIVSGDTSLGASAVSNPASPSLEYSISKVESTAVLGRDAQRVTVVDGQGDLRATMTFDQATGALVASRIRNADGSVYCEIRIVEFNDVAATAAKSAASDVTANLELVDAVDDERLPVEVGGFSRLDTYRWDDDGMLGYYSDGLFSFALFVTDRPLVLDDSSARAVSVDGGEYVRWFGPGQVIYVWDTTAGGLALYGDLPLDLQEQVVSALPEPRRGGLLSRWWRSIFG